MSGSSAGAAPSSPAARLASFRSVLGGEVVDLSALRALAYALGIPEEERGLRALVWKLLLGLLPPERDQWAPTLRRKRAEYDQFCQELVVDPATLGAPPPPPAAAAALAPTLPPGGGGGGGAAPVAADDHPLSTSDDSRWRAYFADSETRDQIERDVARTHPDLQFFAARGGAAEARRAALRRALFVFAKLNPGLRYVQGMNELMAPLFHTFATDPSPGAAAAAEADAFFCFVDLLASCRDHYCQQLDNSQAGIRAAMSRLSAALRAHDQELWAHLEGRNGVNPQFYAFRWVTTLLTQEFSFPDAVRVWDALLSDPGGREEGLQRVCLAMVLLVRDELLAGDFAANMKLLQRFPPLEVAAVLRRAEALRRCKTVLVLDD